MLNIIIVPSRGFDDRDIIKILNMEKNDELVIISDSEKALGKYGLKIIPDMKIMDILKINPTEVNKIYIIADEGWEKLRNSLELKEFLWACNSINKKIIAISLAPLLLLEFKILLGRRLTYNKDLGNYDDLLKKYKAVYCPEKICKEENIITMQRA